MGLPATKAFQLCLPTLSPEGDPTTELDAGEAVLTVGDKPTGKVLASGATERSTGAGVQEIERESWIAHKEETAKHEVPREGDAPFEPGSPFSLIPARQKRGVTLLPVVGVRKLKASD